MKISQFDKTNILFKKEAADLLVESFPHSYSECALEEIDNCLEEERIAIMAIDQGQLVGFVGAIPQYGITGWELHPLVVKKTHQFKGIGAQLVKALEEAVASKGGITIYLGTDDEFNQTSLSNTDLYDKLYEKMANPENFKKHPFEFYQKIGYKIVGVIPDANGIGKPDIYMAKRVCQDFKD